MNGIRKFFKGLRLFPVASTAVSEKGDIEVLDTGGKINYHNGTTASPVVTESHTATLTGKTLVVASNTITTAANGNLVATELNTALAELQTDIDTRVLQSDFSAHLADGTDAHDASAISFTPAGSIVATDVQTAVSEVSTDAASSLSTHEADTSTHGVGEIVGRTETQTLTNKTLTSPKIATSLTTDTDTDLTIDPNGTGNVLIPNSNLNIGDGAHFSTYQVSLTKDQNTTTAIRVANNDSGSNANATIFTSNGTSNLVATKYGVNTTSAAEIIANGGHIYDSGGGLSICAQGAANLRLYSGGSGAQFEGIRITGSGSNRREVMIPYGYITIAEQPTPSTPSSGYGAIYFKTDGALYQLNDAGTETLVTPVITDWTAFPSNPLGGLTIGDGTQSFFYRRVNDTLEIKGRVTIGSTSSFGGGVTITLPNSLAVDAAKMQGTGANNLSYAWVGNVHFIDASSGNSFMGVAYMNTTTTVTDFMGAYNQGIAISATSPVNPVATGDVISYYNIKIPISGW